MITYSVPVSNKAYARTVSGGTVFNSSGIRIEFDTTAVALIINNLSNQNVSVRLNDDSGCVFTLVGLTSWTFDPGSVMATVIDFQNNASGASAANVEVVASLI